MRVATAVLGVLVVWTVGCGGGGSAAAPSTPAPAPTPTPAPDITLELVSTATGSVISSGATVSNPGCGDDDPNSCTEAVSATATVTANRGVSDPMVALRFYDATGRECVFGIDLPPPGLTAFVPQTFEFGPVLAYSIVSFPLDLSPACPPPFTTSSIIVRATETTTDGPLIIDKRFDVTITWEDPTYD